MISYINKFKAQASLENASVLNVESGKELGFVVRKRIFKAWNSRHTIT